MKVFGIDLSCWQKGYPYAKATKEGVKFAILRAGFWTTKDSVFETHYKEARKQKWDIGAYWYSYATTEAQARMEAKAFIKAIAGKQFEYPVYVDIEDKSLKNLSKAQLDKNIIAFANEIKKAGYLFGVYTNTSWYTSKLNGKKLNKSYEWWIAQWSTNPPKNIDYGVWQFGGATNYIRSPKIAGVTTDQNYAVKDYLTYIKANGLNGYDKPAPDPDPKPTPKPVEKVYKKTTEALNMRKGAGLEYLVILTIPKGKKVEVLKANAKKADGYIWDYILYKNKKGYAANKYLKKV